MRRILAFLILSVVKIFSTLFYRCHYQWLGDRPEFSWKDIRLIVFLNHTSLYEPLFSQILPFRYLWHLAGHANIPGADITLSRPMVGTFWKLMVPNISSISRKKDETWDNYLCSIGPEDVVMIAPEGRMKRPNGLDKYGRRMSVRGGVADIISNLPKGKMLLCLSGGLHHVQSPGQNFPRLFKSIRMNLELIEIQNYKKSFSSHHRERKILITRDLQERLERNCP